MSEQENTMDLETARTLLLDSLMHKESRYEIDVIDNSMLPDNLKDREVLHFVIKPPVILTLTRMASVALRIPEEYRQIEVDPIEVLKYGQEVAEIFAIMAHGSNEKPMPDWYVPFLMKNCTPADLLRLYQESSMKIRTDFFLPCFQIASAANPMLMKRMTGTNLNDS